MSANKCFVSHKTVEHRKDTCYDFYHLEFKYNDSSKEASCLLSYGSQECESYSADQYLLKGAITESNGTTLSMQVHDTFLRHEEQHCEGGSVELTKVPNFACVVFFDASNNGLQILFATPQAPQQVNDVMKQVSATMQVCKESDLMHAAATFTKTYQDNGDE